MTAEVAGQRGDAVTMGPTSQPLRAPTESELAALVALYGAERSDASNALTVTIGLLGAVSAYVAGVLVFGGSVATSPLFWIIIPFPAWAGLSTQLMIMSVDAQRAKSLFRLEERLARSAGISAVEHAEIGYANVEKAMVRFRPSFVANYVLAYAMELAGVVALNAYCLVMVWRSAGSPYILVIPAALNIGWIAVASLTARAAAQTLKEAHDYRDRIVDG